MSGFVFLTLKPLSSLVLGQLGQLGGRRGSPGELPQHPCGGCGAAREGSRAVEPPGERGMSSNGEYSSSVKGGQGRGF